LETFKTSWLLEVKAKAHRGIDVQLYVRGKVENGYDFKKELEGFVFK
jgi:hypothetical protein